MAPQPAYSILTMSPSPTVLRPHWLWSFFHHDLCTGCALILARLTPSCHSGLREALPEHSVDSYRSSSLGLQHHFYSHLTPVGSLLHAFNTYSLITSHTSQTRHVFNLPQKHSAPLDNIKAHETGALTIA